MARVFPLLAAVCRKEPRPGRRKSLSPRTNISHAIRKNQPPATDIMEFQTMPIVENGRSSSMKRCQGTEAIDDGGFAEIAGNRFQRGIKTEGDVPHLPGKNEDDGADFDAQLPVRNERHHGEHDARKKTQHRD